MKSSNETLIKESKKFHILNKDYSKGDERALLIERRVQNGFENYYISYLFEYYDAYDNLIINQVARLSDLLVFFSDEKNKDYLITEDFFLRIAAIKFPKVYKSYKQNNNSWPIPPTRHGVPYWKLTFHNDTLSQREILED